MILHLKDSTYYGLDAVAATVWNQLQQPRTVAELREAVLRQHEVGSGECEPDLLGFLETISVAGLIQIQDGKVAKGSITFRPQSSAS